MQLRNVKESLTTRSNSSGLEIGTKSLINSEELRIFLSHLSPSFYVLSMSLSIPQSLRPSFLPKINSSELISDFVPISNLKERSENTGERKRDRRGGPSSEIRNKSSN